MVVARSHESGGNSIYLEDDDGWYYAYLHINNDTPFTDDGANPIEWAFAPGTTVGSRVDRGQFIAYVGDSGNAESAGPHCHFEIRKPIVLGGVALAGRQPKYSLDGGQASAPAGAARDVRAVGQLARPHRPAVRRLLRPVTRHGRAQLLPARARPGGAQPRLAHPGAAPGRGCQRSAGAVVRLYNAYFGRYPDQSGFAYWVGSVRGGRRLAEIAQHFATSTEFRREFGDLSNEGFVDTVYENVLGRAADSGGKNYWLRRLDSGSVSRGRLMIEFSESSENRTRRRIPTNVVLIYGLMHRIPSDDAVSEAVMALATQSVTHQGLIRGIRLSDEYAARF